MVRSRFVSFGVAAMATLAAAGTAQATITTYTSQAAFNAATTLPGVDTYTGFSVTGSTPSPITRSAGAYTYTANPTPTGTFFGAGSVANPWLSTNTATDTINFFNFVGGVQAAGGNFFGSDISGLFAAGSVMLTATDSSGTVSQSIVGATTTSFVGFVSDGALISMTVSAVQPTPNFLWPTVDNLVLAQAIPTPGAAALLGLGGLAAGRRRRN